MTQDEDPAGRTIMESALDQWVAVDNLQRISREILPPEVHRKLRGETARAAEASRREVAKTECTTSERLLDLLGGLGLRTAS